MSKIKTSKETKQKQNRISQAVVILQRRKVVRSRCTVLLDKGLFLKKKNDVCNKTLRLALKYLKTDDLEYSSSLSVAWMVRFWFKSLQSLATYA